MSLSKTHQLQYLSSLSYNSNEFGQESLQELRQLIPNLICLNLSNLTMHACASKDKEQDYTPHQLIENVLYCTAYQGSKLMQLKLSNINLRNHKIVENIVATIKFNKNLTHLDLSWTALQAK